MTITLGSDFSKRAVSPDQNPDLVFTVNSDNTLEIWNFVDLDWPVLTHKVTIPFPKNITTDPSSVLRAVKVCPDGTKAVIITGNRYFFVLDLLKLPQEDLSLKDKFYNQIGL